MVDQSKAAHKNIKQQRGQKKKQMVTNLEIRTCHGCDSLASLQKGTYVTIRIYPPGTAQGILYIKRMFSKQTVQQLTLYCRQIRHLQHRREAQQCPDTIIKQRVTGCPYCKACSRDLQLFDWEGTQISCCSADICLKITEQLGKDAKNRVLYLFASVKNFELPLYEWCFADKLALPCLRQG